MIDNLYIKMLSNLGIKENRFKETESDFIYKCHFMLHTAPKIFEAHVSCPKNFCTFCNNLLKSSSHKFCFKCIKKTYSGSTHLLPGTFSFTGSYYDSAGGSCTPWLLRAPCQYFERLELKNYFRNFIFPGSPATIELLEAAEGIFTGMSRGKRPCHICASTGIEIYNHCFKAQINSLSLPCTEILDKISLPVEIHS